MQNWKRIVEGSLFDLGESVSIMLWAIAQYFGLENFVPTKKTLLLADGSIKTPMGVLENVPVKVGDYFVPCDFFILHWNPILEELPLLSLDDNF